MKTLRACDRSNIDENLAREKRGNRRFSPLLKNTSLNIYKVKVVHNTTILHDENTIVKHPPLRECKSDTKHNDTKVLHSYTCVRIHVRINSFAKLMEENERLPSARSLSLINQMTRFTTIFFFFFPFFFFFFLFVLFSKQRVSWDFHRATRDDPSFLQ